MSRRVQGTPEPREARHADSLGKQRGFAAAPDASRPEPLAEPRDR